MGRSRAGAVVPAGVPFTSLSEEVTAVDLQRAPVAANVRPVRGGGG